MRDNKNLMKNQNTVSWHTEYPRSWFNNLVFYSSFVAVLLAIFDTGFEFNLWFQGFTSSFYLLALTLSLIELLLHCRRWYARSTMLAVFNTLTAMLVVALIVTHFVDEDSSMLYKFLFEKSLIKIAVLLSFIRQLFERDFEFKFAVTHPAQLFIISYLLLILLGTFLLMMPNASYGYLSFVDALFTATSAVCITGLTVKDTGAFFTPLGQVIIICLIQLGGLGILTFATYFGYFFRGKISYETQLTIGQVTASNRLGDVLKTLKVILVVTFGVELMAAIAIYLSVLDLPMSTSNRLFFAIFHAISAFCNAGFSTLSDSLHHEQVQFNYALQLIIVVTFLFGGLGFVIVANVLSYLKHRLLRLVSPNPHRHGAKPWLLSINSRISLVTSAVLLVLGFLVAMAAEWQGVLTDHASFWGKLVTAIFIAATPRSSGFNTMDMTQLAFPTVMMMIGLMWVGASPNSTGGGIKTSTLAVAVLNIWSIARGYTRIEVFQREIADISVRRAFAVMCLSVILIAIGCTMIRWAEPNFNFSQILFESVSAYSTAGLSLGITPDLTPFSKLVLVALMFIGRVSALTILIALFNRLQHQNYRYPSEEIIIN